MPPPPAGLCDSCRHRRLVRNTRGSTFSLCERSRSDPSFPRYPRLPVLHCAGHERAPDRPAADRPPDARSGTGPETAAGEA